MADNNIQLFESKEIRFVDHPEKKYGFGIVAADLAQILEIQRVNDLMSPVDEEWKGADIIRTPGGTQAMTVIWEPGIYQVLAKSRKPKAKPFQKWLFEQVLPKIRETGQYIQEVQQPIKRVSPQRDAVDYANAATQVANLPNGILKQLLSNALIDELELQQNLKYLPVAEKPKKYTIAKVRAKMLGYTDAQIGNGSGLGRFIRSAIEPAFQEMVGRFPVFHYEVNEELDRRIHLYFS